MCQPAVISGECLNSALHERLMGSATERDISTVIDHRLHNAALDLFDDRRPLALTREDVRSGWPRMPS